MGPLSSRAGWQERGGLSVTWSGLTAQGRSPPPQSQGAPRNVSQAWLLWMGDTRAAQPQKELLSLSLPPPTPTHSDGLFVVTSAASGGPWEGRAGGRTGTAVLRVVPVRPSAPSAGTGLLSLCLFPRGAQGAHGSTSVYTDSEPFLPESLGNISFCPGAFCLQTLCPRPPWRPQRSPVGTSLRQWDQEGHL